jgi:hypothetical protein
MASAQCSEDRHQRCRAADTTVGEARFVLFSNETYAAFEAALADIDP